MFALLERALEKYSLTSPGIELVKDFSSCEVVQTPYNLAKQEWDNRMGCAMISAKNWRLMSFLLGAVLLLSFGLLYKQSDRHPVKPILIEIESSTGEVKMVENINAIAFNPSESLKKHFIWNWIVNLRGISSDLVLVNNKLVSPFNFVTEMAHNQLADFVNNSHPFVRSKNKEIDHRNLK